MKRRIFQTSLIATTLALAGLSGANAQQTIRLTAAAGHPPVFLWVKTVHEVLRVGQEVNVQVLEVTPSKKRISLSLKALKEKPEDVETPEETGPAMKHIDPESLKGGIGEPTGGLLFGDPKKFGR